MVSWKRGLRSTAGSYRNGDPIAFSFMRELRVVMYVLISGNYLFRYEGLTSWQTVFVITSILLFITSHLLHFNKRTMKYYLYWSSIDFLITLLFGLIFPSSTLYQINFGIIGVTIFLFTNNRRILVTAGVLFSVVWLLLWGYHIFVTGEYDLFEMFINLGYIANSTFVGGLMSYLLRARTKLEEQYEMVNESHLELQAAHDQLQQYAQQVEELTTTRERNVIAREIHDTVGHTMTALIVQLQAARMLKEHDLIQADATLARCEELARSALQEVRLSVRTLHNDSENQLTLTENLRKLLEDFSDMTGMKTTLQLKGDLSRVSASLQPTVYRLIQEALTNAKRHGNATEAFVTILSLDDRLELEIVDNGVGVTEVVPGFGLMNMRERVLEQSGSIHFESKKGDGFRVHISFPSEIKTWVYRGALA